MAGDLGGDDLDLEAAARVERTGIALVHEGELVVPAPGAAADLVAAGRASHDDGPAEVHYWFPVQVEVVGLDDATADAVVARVFDALGAELGARG
ncbi:hypothetical protein IC607_13575 [Cellulomonas sp. JH27-2]|uniref:hypothetical protein n=1 Tax=Cellulomonas sp. JH27-2 TaxID=2774139 RepID=UPI00177CCBF7|nr:hypothetical protein [Cellulomonas sp. JH27-2]MBD8059999.1 hypothetical protein [Cellulomonas sp. JH27-2]